MGLIRSLAVVTSKRRLAGGPSNPSFGMTLTIDLCLRILASDEPKNSKNLGFAYYGIVRVILKEGLMGREPAIGTCMTTKLLKRHVLQHKPII